MRKFFILPILLSLLIGGVVFAQTEGLPKAGITPESPFYFLDRLGEALQDFFTFNPEGKARLQITFAAERVAEIKIILETKGVEAKGIEVAQERLQAQLGKAAIIVIKEKSKGKDVSALAKELDDEFEAPKSALAQTFKEQERALEAKEDELKDQLKAAHRAGDVAQGETIAAELGQIRAQLELLDLRKEDIEDEIEAEEDRIEEEMEAENKAQEAIEEAEEEKQEVLDETAEEGVELPVNAFAEFDSLLSQAQNAFAAKNFQEARQLAKQAEDVAEKLGDIVDEVEEMMDAKEEAEEAIQEAQSESAEILAKAQEKGVSAPADFFAEFNTLFAQATNAFAAGNYMEAKQLAEQAEDTLEEAENLIDELEEETEELKDGEEDENEKMEEEDEQMIKDEDEEPLVITLSPQNDSGESGTATLKQENGKTKVVVDLDSAPSSAQPAHIHTGSCADLGGVKYPLISPVDGESETLLDVPLTQLVSELPLAINVHKSSEEISVYVACGDITP